MSWSITLWDQFDNVSRHTEKGIEFCEKVLNFVKERAAIELEYAAKLKKLTKSYLPKVEKNDKRAKEEEDEFTSAKGFHKMVHEIKDLSGQREEVSNKLTNAVVKDLLINIQDAKQERKKLVAEGTKQMAIYQNQMQQLDRIKKQTERAFKDLEKAQEAQMKAEQEQHLPKAEIDKVKQAVVARQQDFDKSKTDYQLEVARTRNIQNEHFTSSMPKIFQQLQDSDKKRINGIQTVIRLTADIERQSMPICEACVKGVEEAVRMVDYNKDAQTVIDKYRTGYHPPSDVEYEDFGSKTSLTSKNDAQKGGVGKRLTFFTKLRGQKADEARDDFSHLPPSQQKKHLKMKIDGLKSELAKETNEREGLIKLQSANKQLSKASDQASISKQIDECSQNISRIQQEIHKYEAVLAEVDAYLKAEPSAESTYSPASTSRSSAKQASAEVVVQVTRYEAHPQVEHDSFDEDEDDGTCVALYAYQANTDDAISMKAGEQFSVVDRDKGDGWTRVRNSAGNVGYVPTSYIECHFDV